MTKKQKKENAKKLRSEFATRNLGVRIHKDKKRDIKLLRKLNKELCNERWLYEDEQC